MTPLPCWSDKTEDERRDLCRQLAREVSEDAAIAREYTGARVLGLDRLLEIDPHHRPEHTDHSPAPMCHASDPRTRKDWRARYDAYVDGYRIAREQMRELGESIDFPAGGIRPLYRMEADPPKSSAAASAA